MAKPTWNALVCKGDVGRMSVGGGGGAVGFGGFGGGGVLVPALLVRWSRCGPARPGSRPVLALRAPVPACGAPRPAAATPVVFEIAPGGGRIRGTPAPSGPPVVLSRNGKQFTADGETNVRAGTEYKVTTERPSVNLNVKELDTGS